MPRQQEQSAHNFPIPSVVEKIKINYSISSNDKFDVRCEHNFLTIIPFFQLHYNFCHFHTLTRLAFHEKCEIVELSNCLPYTHSHQHHRKMRKIFPFELLNNKEMNYFSMRGCIPSIKNITVLSWISLWITFLIRWLDYTSLSLSLISQHTQFVLTKGSRMLLRSE